MSRLARFIKSCIRLRSVSLALWVDSYDNAKVAKLASTSKHQLSAAWIENTYVVAVLEAEVKKVAHEASLLSRMLRGNPYLTEGSAE